MDVLSTFGPPTTGVLRWPSPSWPAAASRSPLDRSERTAWSWAEALSQPHSRSQRCGRRAPPASAAGLPSDPSHRRYRFLTWWVFPFHLLGPRELRAQIALMGSATRFSSVFCSESTGAASAGRCGRGRSGWRAGSGATTRSSAACPSSSAAPPSSLSSSTAPFPELPPSPTPPGLPALA